MNGITSADRERQLVPEAHFATEWCAVSPQGDNHRAGSRALIISDDLLLPRRIGAGPEIKELTRWRVHDNIFFALGV
jgi:hypothetical protein